MTGVCADLRELAEREAAANQANGGPKRDSLGSMLSSAGESIYEDASEGEGNSQQGDISFGSLHSNHDLDRKPPDWANRHSPRSV